MPQITLSYELDAFPTSISSDSSLVFISALLSGDASAMTFRDPVKHNVGYTTVQLSDSTTNLYSIIKDGEGLSILEPFLQPSEFKLRSVSCNSPPSGSTLIFNNDLIDPSLLSFVLTLSSPLPAPSAGAALHPALTTYADTEGMLTTIAIRPIPTSISRTRISSALRSALGEHSRGMAVAFTYSPFTTSKVQQRSSVAICRINTLAFERVRESLTSWEGLVRLLAGRAHVSTDSMQQNLQKRLHDAGLFVDRLPTVFSVDKIDHDAFEASKNYRYTVRAPPEPGWPVGLGGFDATAADDRVISAAVSLWLSMFSPAGAVQSARLLAQVWGGGVPTLTLPLEPLPHEWVPTLTTSTSTSPLPATPAPAPAPAPAPTASPYKRQSVVDELRIVSVAMAAYVTVGSIAVTPLVDQLGATIEGAWDVAFAPVSLGRPPLATRAGLVVTGAAGRAEAAEELGRRLGREARSLDVVTGDDLLRRFEWSLIAPKHLQDAARMLPCLSRIVVSPNPDLVNHFFAKTERAGYFHVISWQEYHNIFNDALGNLEFVETPLYTTECECVHHLGGGQGVCAALELRRMLVMMRPSPNIITVMMHAL